MSDSTTIKNTRIDTVKPQSTPTPTPTKVKIVSVFIIDPNTCPELPNKQKCINDTVKGNTQSALASGVLAHKDAISGMTYDDYVFYSAEYRRQTGQDITIEELKRDFGIPNKDRSGGDLMKRLADPFATNSFDSLTITEFNAGSSSNLLISKDVIDANLKK